MGVWSSARCAIEFESLSCTLRSDGSGEFRLETVRNEDDRCKFWRGGRLARHLKLFEAQ